MRSLDFVTLSIVTVAVAAPISAVGPSRPAVAETTGQTQARPAIPDGTEPAVDAGGGYAKTDTIRSQRNRLGETVHAVAASHFDVSPPLRDVAVRAIEEYETEEEASREPQLPPWRRVLSSVPDPVVQAGIPPLGAAEDSVRTAAPTTGFNFAGVGMSSSSPSDSNGSVGNDQYVETVNIRYQVWSLQRTNNTVTTLLGPISINSLWSGFGGPCQTQNSGDPIVLFDKIAKRWLISQFTRTPASGLYYQCVAVSTTADATGSFYRWAFAVPDNLHGDYPHFGTWTDAYYMMAHGFVSASGGWVAALFAALDRPRMLAGDAGATWIVIEDPFEGGHMPADLDGFAPPPTNAPGIFVSLHEEGMAIYRMHVDFAEPGNTVRTRQMVSVAPSTGACAGGGACIPQPGTSRTVASIGDRLMFRAAYRNLIDRESLVVSHSVDPSVPGVVSGVRWYDFRLSGTPDATCATYPCIHQQGTFADAPNGRSRWMPSIAMDGAENILIGYSTTGTADGTDNHSIRYTGRARNDPPGTLTAPESIVVTGTANNTGLRWGDYTSMSVDPHDDCTFWYVNQYFSSSGSWSTRIASAAFPPGSGEGQCPRTSCTARPGLAPAIGAASVPGDNRIAVTWTGIVPSPGSYAIERADGPCGSAGIYRPLGRVPGSVTSFTDTSVLGGLTYSYRVIAAADAGGRCQALVRSACVQATATGACALAPSFAGATGATSVDQSTCGVVVSWAPATSSCPLTPDVTYSVYRGGSPDFDPSPANRIATCVASPSSYLDTANLHSGVTYYYVVRAEDSASGHGGECGGGNAEANTVAVPGTAYGSGTQSTPGMWTDGAGDGTAFLQLNAAGAGNTGHPVWRVVRAADDPGANHTSGGAYGYRNAGPGPAADYAADECAEVATPPLAAGAPTIQLQYWERHQMEYRWDGVAVEYSLNDGPWIDVPAPSNETSAGCAASDVTTGWEPLSCAQDPPINGCDYPSTKMLYSGAAGSGTSCEDYTTASTVTPWAHRCHPIGGLEPGDSVRLRWRFTSDAGAQYAGFYLDDVAVSGILLPNACASDCSGQSDGTPCEDGDPCTSGDACGVGTCLAGATVPPPEEISGLIVKKGAAGTTVLWTPLPGGDVVHDVASSTVSQLRADGDSSNATCLADDVTGSNLVDPRPDPPSGEGYYYLVRAQGACGSGTYGFDSASVERLPASDCP